MKEYSEKGVQDIGLLLSTAYLPAFRDMIGAWNHLLLKDLELNFLQEEMEMFLYANLPPEIDSNDQNFCREKIDELSKLFIEQIKENAKETPWKVIKEISPTLEIDKDEWRKQLDRSKMSQDEIETILKTYESWRIKVENTDFEVVQWLCHGKIGFAFILAVYTQCLNESCDHLSPKQKKSQRSKFLSISPENRKIDCFKVWGHLARMNQCEYPKDVLKLLDLQVP